jgi:hypothetical protein
MENHELETFHVFDREFTTIPAIAAWFNRTPQAVHAWPIQFARIGKFKVALADEVRQLKAQGIIPPKIGAPKHED